ncbi:MAG: Hint domain-containing protein [Roseovarius sp.]|nr:Hint domain-containing protein [Roseovarius sp.]
MVKIFEAPDNEFAVATGNNVNSNTNGLGTSTFDYPPNSSKDFIVTSNSGDPSPNEFSLGDTYDLSWGGNGGGSTIEDAVVIRSDPLSGDGGAIVFEGYDESGSLTQVVWSPDFDLEGWYWDNFSGGNSPGFYTTDQVPSYTHSVVCFAADTPILTRNGPCAATDIEAGQKVWTLDAGYQPVLWIGRTTVIGSGNAIPVMMREGTIGNDRPLVVSPQHRLLIRSPMAELNFTNHEVLIPAQAMISQPGVTAHQVARITYVHLLLSDHHILQAAGALCESLFLGDIADSITAQQMSATQRQAARKLRHIAARPMLTHREARSLVGARMPRARQPAM